MALAQVQGGTWHHLLASAVRDSVCTAASPYDVRAVLGLTFIVGLALGWCCGAVLGAPCCRRELEIEFSLSSRRPAALTAEAARARVSGYQLLDVTAERPKRH